MNGGSGVLEKNEVQLNQNTLSQIRTASLLAFIFLGILPAFGATVFFLMSLSSCHVRPQSHGPGDQLEMCILGWQWLWRLCAGAR